MTTNYILRSIVSSNINSNYKEDTAMSNISTIAATNKNAMNQEGSIMTNKNNTIVSATTSANKEVITIYTFHQSKPPSRL